MYKVKLLDEAIRNLGDLDEGVASQVVRKLNWLAENAESIRPKGLKNELTGLSKLRVGDYRIIYELFRDEEIVLIRFIGHRSVVYKSR